MIKYRHDDGTTRAAASATLAVATFGRGLFTASLMAPLPVELYSFDANPRVSAISLDWKTGTESNNKGFEVQRSTNQNSKFSTIGWVEGTGTTNYISNYSFNDTDVKSEVTYYYRLKQIDFDGAFEYSDIVSAVISKSDTNTLSVYPNPASDQATIKLPFSEVGFAINLFDSNGRLVKTWKSEKDALTQELDLINISKGIYTLNINNQQIRQSVKLMIVK